MNSRAHWTSATAGFFILVIGVAEVLPIPFPKFLPPSWQVWYTILPDWLDWTYTTLWAVAGLVALAGAHWTGAQRIGFRLSALLFLSWGVAGIQAMVLDQGGNVQGSSANFAAAVLAWHASYGVTVGEGIERLDKKVNKVQERGPD